MMVCFKIDRQEYSEVTAQAFVTSSRVLSYVMLLIRENITVKKHNANNACSNTQVQYVNTHTAHYCMAPVIQHCVHT